MSMDPKSSSADAQKDWVQELVRIMARLRGPKGCPWDREQTHEMLKKYLVEETAELLDAIDDQDASGICEELGDVLLQVVFHAQVAADAGQFDLQAVARGICEKLIRRHPHVFGSTQADTADKVVAQWERIKQQERPNEVRGALHGVPRHLPALQRAGQNQERAAKAGFEWPDVRGALAKVDEELAEVRRALADNDKEALAEEIGDLLFAVSKLSRFLGHAPEEALHKAISKFEQRFRRLEQALAAQGRAPDVCTLDELESLWRQAKRPSHGGAA